MFAFVKKKAKKENLLSMDSYYQKRKFVPDIILNQVRKNKSIVYGARALNEHLPRHLDRHTEDYDVYSNNPLKSARQLEKKLDKFFGGDLFAVERAKYERTIKVISKVTKKTVADFTKPEKKIEYKTSMDGVRFARLKKIEAALRKILRDKESRYRWEKDREALKRIRIFKKLYRKL